MEYTCSASHLSRLQLAQVVAIVIMTSQVPVAIGNSTTAVQTDANSTASPIVTSVSSSTASSIVTSVSSSTASTSSDVTTQTASSTPVTNSTTSVVSTSTLPTNASASVTSSAISGSTTPATGSSGAPDTTTPTAVTSTAATPISATTTPAAVTSTAAASISGTTTPAAVTSTAAASISGTTTPTANATQSTAGNESSANTTTSGTGTSIQSTEFTNTSQGFTPTSTPGVTSQGTSTVTSAVTSTLPASTLGSSTPVSPETTNNENGGQGTAGIIAAVVVLIIAIGLAVALLVVFWLRRQQRWQSVCGAVTRTSKPPRKRVKMKYFASYLDVLRKDSGLLFQDQFEEIQRNTPKTYTYEAALKDENKIKNRYVNIIPYDHTRVKLSEDTEDGGSDFINASYIPGYSSPREYIATQGPMTSTADDFWQMIWEQNSGVIVMLSDLQEKGRRKVDRYWPEEANSPEKFGDLTVELTSVSSHTCYTIRHFKLSAGRQQERTVLQFFIPGWEDHGANLSPDDIISFVQAVRQEARSSEGPVTVHCSAGVGRTGTFIALDFLMQFVQEHDLESEVDVYNLVLNMRHNRPSMVQSEKQYIFIHEVLKIIIERKMKRLQGNNGVRESISAITNPAFETLHTGDADEPNGTSSRLISSRTTPV